MIFLGPAPILFDEWQVAPALWNLVRREVDARSPQRGQFILTGSATPNNDVDRHSGAGRIASLRMRPMSLFETRHSTGEVSLTALFNGEEPSALDPGISVPDIIDRIVTGGWPALQDAPVADAAEWVRDYVTQIIEIDIQTLGRRDPTNVRRLLKSLGRNTGTGLTITAMAKDVGGPTGPASRGTIASSLEVLERLMIIEDAPAWAPHMRSTTPLRSGPTRFMVDPSLAIAALNTGRNQMLNDLNATGSHFEALAVRDMRIYAQPLGGTIHHWRDGNGHEVDIIVALNDGRWGAFEVKMSPAAIDGAAESLLRFVHKIDTTKSGPPAVLGVITTTGMAYRRPDGIHVIPIGTLGP